MDKIKDNLSDIDNLINKKLQQKLTNRLVLYCKKEFFQSFKKVL